MRFSIEKCSKYHTLKGKSIAVLVNTAQKRTAQSQQNDQFENLYISRHGEARSIKFGQQLNLIQRVPLGTLPQEVLTSLPHNHVTLTNLFIYIYRASVVKFGQ